MIRGLYSAAGGLQATSQQQDVISHNLTHAMKPAFRREILQFEGVASQPELLGPKTSIHTDFAPGILEQTGAKLDVALDGPGFFTVMGPSGPLYTRSGVFQLNGQGQLTNPDGLAVQGSSGTIAIPLAGAMEIEIQANGDIVVDGNTIDTLKVTNFENPNELQRVGSSYFQPLPDSKVSKILPEVRQGYRELANTTVVQEMVQMISGARLFDATQRALRQIADTISLNTHPK